MTIDNRSSLHYGDILNTTADVICHQVNCIGIMGSGVALCTRNRYPDVYEEYRNLCISNNPKNLLGKVQIVKTHQDYKYIANCFGQESIGWNKIQTDYNALESSLNQLVIWMIQNNKNSVAIPYKIGCVRGGGNWEIVKMIISKAFASTNIHIEIWKL